MKLMKLPIRTSIMDIFKVLSILAISTIIVFTAVNIYMINSTKNDMLENSDALPKADAVVVLGCLVRPGGDVSLSLRDRLDTALEIYAKNTSLKFIVSGDHGRPDYDEVNAMRNYLVDHGIPSENVFMDHAGFSTYETVYRAKAIFGVKRAIFVSQSYHLARTVYIGKSIGIDSYGVSADKRSYVKILQYRTRESLARVKDFANAVVLKPKPTFLGDMIPISTSKGSDTMDK
jgi:SanA protein